MNRQENYEIDKIADGFYRINEYGISNCYLIEGSEKALLIDTGTGFECLKELVRSLTDKPLIVAATHGHPDHIGGRYFFDGIYLHKGDITFINKLMCSHFVRNFFAKHISAGKENIRGKRIKKAVRGKRILPIEDGYIFELGGRTVRTIALPGHSRGSVGFAVEDVSILLTGDAIRAKMWVFTPDCLSVEEWLDSAQKILELSKSYIIYTGHEPVPMTTEGIEDIIAYGKALVAATPKNKRLSKMKYFWLRPDDPDTFIIYRTGKVLRRKGKSIGVRP